MYTKTSIDDGLCTFPHMCTGIFIVGSTVICSRDEIKPSLMCSSKTHICVVLLMIALFAIYLAFCFYFVGSVYLWNELEFSFCIFRYGECVGHNLEF